MASRRTTRQATRATQIWENRPRWAGKKVVRWIWKHMRRRR